MQNLTSLKNKRRLFLAVVLSAGVLSAIAVIMISQPPNLLVRAHKIFDITDWDQRNPAISRLAFGHYWLSSKEILYAKEEETANEFHLNFYKCNPFANSVTPLTDFTHRMDFIDSSFGIIVSPDGKSLLAINSHNASADIVGIEAKRHDRLSDGTGEWSWSSDSKHLIRVKYPDATHQQSVEFLDLHENGPLSSSTRVWKTSGEDPAFDDIKACGTGHYRLVLSSTEEEDDEKTTVHVVESNFDKSVPDKQFDIPMPFRGDVTDATLSPDGRQIALFVRRTVRNPLFSLLGSLWHGHPYQPPHLVTTLVAGNIRDRKLHTIGVLDETAEDQLHGEAYLTSLQWLPDNRQLSFDYRDAIWLTSVD